MLDINFIRENKDEVKKGLQRRGVVLDIENLLKIDEKRRSLIQEIEELRKKRNEISSMAGEKNIEEGKKIKKVLLEKEPELRETEEKMKEMLFSLPNIPDPEVPDGKDEKDNKQIRKWGQPRTFDFEFKDHVTLGKTLDIIDIERGSKVSGSGFYYLKNEATLLEMGLVKYVIDKLNQRKFQFLTPPDLVKEDAMIGTGFFPTDEQEVYKIEKDGLFLAGTAEVGLASFHSGEIIDEKDLSLYYAAFSTCFRREAGAYGKIAKGVFRVHQFNKVEMFVLATPEKSNQEHEELTKISEEILKDLELPYEVVINCIGDLGFPNRKRYDINTWMPYWNDYRETHSASNDGDFQARRLGIRYRGKDGKIGYCHTINNTAIASPRIIVAILENHQQKDGSIVIPKVLVPYVGFDRISPKT